MEGADNSSAANGSAARPSVPGIFDLTQEDTNWVMTSSFIIFTMQTGFGMLESGCVSVKNEVNIMMKNVVDVVLGGLSYWLFGFAMSFGDGPLTTPVMGVGHFMLDRPNADPLMGPAMAAFLFQLSFSTTATTIVSGAMAERCSFKAYCVFSFLNTVVYCVAAGWVWGEHGFLYRLGVVDIAGSGPVHLIGGSSALAGALMLGPRLGRYERDGPLPMGSPVNAAMGLFVLWWGWLAFNSGSTYGLSGDKWQYAARAAVLTMLASFGGGCVGLAASLLRPGNRFDLLDLVNSILGSLVSITAGCFLYRAWESVLVGAVGAALACIAMPIFDYFHVDDPVGASSVHGVSAIWGVVAVGLFAENPEPLDTTSGRSGLFKGGGWYMLGVQTLSVVCLTTWGVLSNIVLLWQLCHRSASLDPHAQLIDKVIPIRMEAYEELVGADLFEHGIYHAAAGVSRALSALGPVPGVDESSALGAVGLNPGHDLYIEKYVRGKLATGLRPAPPPAPSPPPTPPLAPPLYPRGGGARGRGRGGGRARGRAGPQPQPILRNGSTVANGASSLLNSLHRTEAQRTPPRRAWLD